MQQIGMRICGFLLCVALLAVPALLQLEGFTAEAAGYKVGMIRVEDTPVNIRSGPGTNYDRVAQMSNGRILYVLRQQGEWYQIALGAGQSAFGWIHGDYLTAVTTVNDDPAFTSYLQSQGFPRSYWDSLRVLHAIYPNWTFEALHTGRTWAEVMQGENKKPINMVPMQKGDPYVDRTDVDINGNQIEWDTGWVKAHPDIVAYYMDPRNLLNDYHIFQFEDLRFHEGQHTLAGTGTNIRNTFMDGSTVKTVNGVKRYPGGVIADGNVTFQQAIYDISKQNNVSPYHIAARIKQEMGPQGVSNLAWGAVPGYPDAFNFFNWGAYKKDGLSAVENGALYAKNHGWNTPYKALESGISLLSGSYIGIGQNTLYLQKFNVGENTKYDPFEHQYMSNVMAPTSESYSVSVAMRNVFGDSFATLPIRFQIPVYKDMPENAVEHPLSTQYVPSSNLVTDSVISTEEYTISSDSMISGIELGTTPQTFLSNINVVLDGGSIYLFDSTGKVKSEGTVCTGDRLQVWKSNGELFREYGVVIYGDTSGDGKITIVDLLNVQQHLLELKVLSGSYVAGADVNRDGKVNIADLLGVQRHLLNLTLIQQK